MTIKSETLGTLVKTGVVYAALTLVVSLCALIVLVEVLFEKLMSLTTSLREGITTASNWIVRTSSRFVTNATTLKLKKWRDSVVEKLDTIRNRSKV